MEPNLQVVKDRLGVFLTQGHAFRCWQEPRLCLYIIELLDPQDGFARHRQLGALIKVKERTSHMRNTGHFFDPPRAVGIIIPRIGVRVGKAFVGRKMPIGMLRPSTGRELVPHRGRYPAGPSCLIPNIGPQPCGFGLVLSFAIALLEQLDRGIIYKDRLRFKDVIADRIRDALQQFGAFTDSPGHKRSIQIDAFVLKHLALSIQRQVIAVFAAQDVGHQRWTHKALWPERPSHNRCKPDVDDQFGSQRNDLKYIPVFPSHPFQAL